jgi:hypothetical protein
VVFETPRPSQEDPISALAAPAPKRSLPLLALAASSDALPVALANPDRPVVEALAGN